MPKIKCEYVIKSSSACIVRKEDKAKLKVQKVPGRAQLHNASGPPNSSEHHPGFCAFAVLAQNMKLMSPSRHILINKAYIRTQQRNFGSNTRLVNYWI